MEDPGLLLEPHADKATLIDAVSDPDPAVRFRACRLLDHHELDRSVATRMLAALQDPNKKVRHAALHTLGCEPCKPDGGECFPVDVAGVTVDVLRNDRSLRVRRSRRGDDVAAADGAAGTPRLPPGTARRDRSRAPVEGGAGPCLRPTLPCLGG
ncbi:MAG TPA: HEAT repeat domain-containing protein [Mycobacteriales bacterium]